MKAKANTIGLMLFLAALSSAANAAIDMDKSYSCTVTSSTQSGIPVGSKTTNPFTLKSLLILKFDTGSGFSFYGTLKPFFDGTHDLVLALDANNVREVYGTVYVKDKTNGRITMDILLLETERKLVLPLKETENEERFVFTASNRYSLDCVGK